MSDLSDSKFLTRILFCHHLWFVASHVVLHCAVAVCQLFNCRNVSFDLIVCVQTVAMQTAAMQLTVEVFSANFRTTLNTDIAIKGVYTTQVLFTLLSCVACLVAVKVGWQCSPVLSFGHLELVFSPFPVHIDLVVCTQQYIWTDEPF